VRVDTDLYRTVICIWDFIFLMNIHEFRLDNEFWVGVWQQRCQSSGGKPVDRFVIVVEVIWHMCHGKRNWGKNNKK